ncbi:MAG: M23 family metallopeptidase [Faecalibacterium sp.]|nr:M23 family metallopeptidase [Ruminococcus sp.]MCM1392598.1 M23 family metallopeptidase [Ruminococcus sp.]MCM1486537.1 M23 family metallopeptidase [Faecalibacterium sp.]
MSELSNEIFHGAKHKMSSPFGKRGIIKTTAGNTSSFHSGTDYSTYSVKLAQYAVADGIVDSCGKDSYGAVYAWISYPELNVRMLHYHLDSLSIKSGQKVNKNTVIGYTGKTGKATGIHLHLGIKRIGSNDYIDPEKWSSDEFKKDYKTGNYKVTKANLLHVRNGAGTNFAKLSFAELTKDAQKKVLALSGKKSDGYVNGVMFSVFEVKGNWGRTPSGWVCLDYCEVI